MRRVRRATRQLTPMKPNGANAGCKQGEIEQARTTRAEQLARDGTPGEHHPAILAKESSLVNRHRCVIKAQ